MFYTIISVVALLLLAFAVLLGVPAMFVAAKGLEAAVLGLLSIEEFLRLREKLLLTLEEANDLTGLPTELLEIAVKEGALKSVGMLTSEDQDGKSDESLILVSRRAVEEYARKHIKAKLV